MPYYIPVTMASANINALKILIQFDPYTNNQTLPKGRKWEKRRRLESEVINKLDSLFVVDFVYDEMSRLGLGNANKLVSMPFPAIETDADGNFNNLEDFNNKLNRDNKNKIIKFLYTGVFYDIIRNPEFLLKLFEKLPENYEFHFVGGGAWNTVKKFVNELGKRLVLYGWRSSDEVKNFLREADILVCLNNSITNQMSSKILEYICTGKPVLNIYKVDDCPSLKYTARYKNCMDLKEAEITPEMLNKIINFVDTHINTIEPLDDIMKNFKENTDFHAANMIEDKLNELLQNRSK